MNTFDFSNTLNAPLKDIGEVLQDPSTIVSEQVSKIEKISDTKWKEIESEDLYNVLEATFSNDEVHITSVNAKYDSERCDIVIALEAIDDASTNVKVHYEIKTGALFNKISLKLFGEKLAHHADNVIIKNIEKRLK